MTKILNFSPDNLSEAVQNAFLGRRSRERSEFAYLAEGRKSCRADKSIPAVSGGTVAGVDACDAASGDGAPDAASGDGSDDGDDDGGEPDRRTYQNRAAHRHPAKETPALSSANPPRFLRLKEVMHRTGYGRSSIYAHVLSGKFPQSVSLGGRAVGWLESEVTQWAIDRVAARDAA